MDNKNGFYRGSNILLQKYEMASQTSRVPFKGNDLIDKNPLVSSQVNQIANAQKQDNNSKRDYGWQRSNGPTNTSADQPKNIQGKAVRRTEKKKQNDYQDLSRLNDTKMKKSDVIKELLKPINTENSFDNTEVKANLDKLKDEFKYDKKQNQLVKQFTLTNEPYKIIMHDHKINKRVEEIKQSDMTIFDARDKRTMMENKNIGRFHEELAKKKKDSKRINAYLKMEYDDRKHDEHFENYKYKESYVRRLKNVDGKTFDETKQDYIEFYQEQQKMGEKGMKEIDQTIRSLVDQGIIKKEDLPVE